jgi:hypothetical protein
LEVDEHLALSRGSSLYSILVSEAAVLAAAYAAYNDMYLLVIVAVAIALPFLGLYWLSILIAGSASLVALYMHPGVPQLAALLASAVAALLAPRQVPRPPSKPEHTLLLPLLLVVLSPFQVALAVHALESVEPYRYMVHGLKGAAGVFFAAAALAVGSASYLAAKPPRFPLAGKSMKSTSMAVFEVYIYVATLLPAIRVKTVIALFLAGIVVAGLVSAAGRQNLRLLAYMTVYLVLAYLTGAFRAIEAFYYTP